MNYQMISKAMKCSMNCGTSVPIEFDSVLAFRKSDVNLFRSISINYLHVGILGR